MLHEAHTAVCHGVTERIFSVRSSPGPRHRTLVELGAVYPVARHHFAGSPPAAAADPILITSEAKCFVFREREIKIRNVRPTPKFEQIALKYLFVNSL